MKIFGYPSCSPMQYIIDLGELLLSNHSKECKKFFYGVDHATNSRVGTISKG